jgi:hypothetical protein
MHLKLQESDGDLLLMYGISFFNYNSQIVRSIFSQNKNIADGRISTSGFDIQNAEGFFQDTNVLQTLLQKKLCMLLNVWKKSKSLSMDIILMKVVSNAWR